MAQINSEYQQLIDYLTGIMHKLQSQSDFLRHEDIGLCLSNDKEKNNNAYWFDTSKTILLGLQYLKKYAPYGEDIVARIIGHELSHYVFQNKYRLKADKEEEIFADNYSLILCHRAGYNINTQRWPDKELSPNTNPDVHPQSKIRQLIMSHTAAKLNAYDILITPFKIDIPQQDTLVEYQDEFMHDRLQQNYYTINTKNLKTDIFFIKEDKEKNKEPKVYKDESRINYLLSQPYLKSEHKFSIMRINFDNCDLQSLYNLYGKLKEYPKFFNDCTIMQMFRDTLIKRSFVNCRSVKDDGIMYRLDNLFIENIERAKTAKAQRDAAQKLLDIRHRLRRPALRKKLQAVYAKSLLILYGQDNGSLQYRRNLQIELKQLAGKISNADVLPLLQEIRQTLVITNNNLDVLHQFAVRNKFELQQIRAEALITECLLNPNRAIDTVKYLTNNNRNYTQSLGIYNKSSNAAETLHIDDEALSSIRDDWANISPQQRADIFALLLESVCPNNCNKKLAIFTNKKSEKDLLFKPIMEAYIKTYTAKQRPFVVAALISRKDINRPFGYEDYFKTVLENSGIVGERVYSELYGKKISRTPANSLRNYSPIYAEGDIVFANLIKLGTALQRHKNPEYQMLGKQIIAVSHPNKQMSKLER